MKELHWKVGGQQGEGVDSTGEILARALFRYGYFVSTYKQFMSRIKGGHTSYKIRATSWQTEHAGQQTDLLLALDQESYTVSESELHAGSIVIFDGETSVETNARGHVLVSLPLKKIAKELGNTLAKNMIALGVSAGLIGLPEPLFLELIKDIFQRKGESVVSSNQEALSKGYDLARTHLSTWIYAERTLPDLSKANEKKERWFISGNHAVAFGSLLAGCRFLSAYPITPASEIMEWLSTKLPKVGGTIMQVEDEIAGITFAIGASFGGARAMTSTSGPGLSLKTEAIGMAGMSETPLVIVDSQRAGPSTGLPTKFEQSDLQHLLYASHGEIPRVVLYPSSIQDCFQMSIESFNVADQYQCPVFLAIDMGMSMNKGTIEKPLVGQTVDRGSIVHTVSEHDRYHRYAFTEQGVSPRVLPGTPNGAHMTSSNEHGENGFITEDPEIRTRMMDKRMEKIKSVRITNPYYINHEKESILLVGMGSTRGLLSDAQSVLAQYGLLTGHLHIQQLHPLPVQEIAPFLDRKTIIVIENNYEGQLLHWLKQHFAIHDRCFSIRQYDGNPFTVSRIVTEIKGVCARG